MRPLLRKKASKRKCNVEKPRKIISKLPHSRVQCLRYQDFLDEYVTA